LQERTGEDLSGNCVDEITHTTLEHQQKVKLLRVHLTILNYNFKELQGDIFVSMPQVRWAP
jgi:uncharacterized coiled-coil protein SlyX